MGRKFTCLPSNSAQSRRNHKVFVMTNSWFSRRDGDKAIAMDRLQKVLLISLVSAAAIGWSLSRTFQVDMMSAMATPGDPFAISLFLAVWTAGMAAMMFPAISPVILLYDKITRSGGTSGSIVVEHDSGRPSAKMLLFIGSYLAVWALTGLALLLALSLPMSLAVSSLDSTAMGALLGGILVIAGGYQFTPIKTKCLGYCESPMSLFMRRWRGGTSGAITMGTYHGIYCLGCCWPYFLIMVALGWMDIIWMALFAGIIFGEKMWARGIWVAKAAGIGLVATGILVASGIIQVPGTNGAMSMTDSLRMQGMEGSMEEQSPPSEDDIGAQLDSDDQVSSGGKMKDDGGMSGMDMGRAVLWATFYSDTLI
ncbi:MAG TPA: DUF2182 domain-containing protein [Nitrososphaera sp.]|nr:DUF2182 domain-containing protein [Nitrososphaera sp.]